ncbi:hypothetical protein LJC20_00885 [Eubacteriales bacterium OttesenSCG-928-M02]|nr:hypothetical protein [Eubacteriales bacterium OttesenSCG-928-M02]
MNRRRPRRKPTKRFYIIIAALLVAIIGVVFLLTRGPKYQELAEGTISYEAQYPVVIVRDEVVHNASNYGKATFTAIEGQSVSKGAEIANVYKWGYQEKLFTDMIEIQQKIQDYQLNEIWKNTVDKELNNLDAKITTKMGEIAAAIASNKPTDVVSLEQGLNELLAQKQSYLEKNVKADDTLNGLYAQKAQTQQSLDNWKEVVNAAEAGIVSFNLDGWESILNPARMDEITKKELDSAKSGITTVKSNGDTTTRPLYRLVNTYAWYVIIQVDAKKPVDVLKKDEKFLMTFEGYLDRPHEGTVFGSRKPEDGGIFYVIQITEEIGPLISVRNAVANLKKDYAGIKVSKNAIHTVDNVPGVKVLKGAKTTEFIPVEIIIQDDKNAIVAPKDEAGVLTPGMQVELK